MANWPNLNVNLIDYPFVVSFSVVVDSWEWRRVEAWVEAVAADSNERFDFVLSFELERQFVFVCR
jgi:hypothetical protein